MPDSIYMCKCTKSGLIPRLTHVHVLVRLSGTKGWALYTQCKVPRVWTLTTREVTGNLGETTKECAWGKPEKLYSAARAFNMQPQSVLQVQHCSKFSPCSL